MYTKKPRRLRFSDVPNVSLSGDQAVTSCVIQLSPLKYRLHDEADSDRLFLDVQLSVLSSWSADLPPSVVRPLKPELDPAGCEDPRAPWA